MIEKLTDYLIKRRLKKQRTAVGLRVDKKAMFFRVANTLRENKVMISSLGDGIYIRMAGDSNRGGAFSLEWVKVIGYEENKSKDDKPIIPYALKNIK